MLATEDIVRGILNLNDNEYFNADSSVLGPRESKLLSQDFFGVAVNVPQEIDSDIHEKIPMIMAVRLSGDRDWDVRMATNCFVVGINMTNGHVLIGKAFVNEKAMKSKHPETAIPPKQPKPPGLALRMAQLSELDVAKRLQVPMQTGSWAFGVIYYDWVSNTVPVQLTGDEDLPVPQVRPVFPDPVLDKSGKSPCYLALNKTPALPNYGLSFTHEQYNDETHRTLNIYGSFNLKAKTQHLPEKDASHLYEGFGSQHIAATIPATMIVLGIDWENPIKIDWGIPVYGESVEEGSPVQGYFSIDAYQNSHIQQLIPGTFFYYIVLDGCIYGPRSFQVV